MKKKFLLIISVMAVLACLFAITSSAAVTGSTSDEFGEVTEIASITPPKKYGTYEVDTTAKVVLKNADGTFSTYYTYYIYPSLDGTRGMSSPNFTNLKTAVGENYTAASIVRLELLSGMGKLALPSACASTLKELIIPDDTTITTFVAIKNLTALEKIHIGSSVSSLPASMLEGATSLKEVTFGKDFALTEIPNYMFSGCTSLEEIRFPDSVTTFGSGVLRYCTSIKKVYFGKNADTIGTNFFTMKAASPLKNHLQIYASSSIFVSSVPTSFGTNTAITNVTVYYVGTYDEALALTQRSTATGTFPKAIKKAELVKYDDSKSDEAYINPDQTAWTIVYDYSKCLAFYGGHDISDTPVLKCDDFTSNLKLIKQCARECGSNQVLEIYDPIFSGVKYSVKEDGSAICAKFSINTTSIGVYNSYNVDAQISYGFVISSAMDAPLYIGENNTLAKKDGVALVDSSKLAGNYSGFDFIIRGFADPSTSVIISLYTFDGKNIYYVGSSTTKDPVSVSISQLNGN